MWEPSLASLWFQEFGEAGNDVSFGFYSISPGKDIVGFQKEWADRKIIPTAPKVVNN